MISMKHLDVREIPVPGGRGETFMHWFLLLKFSIYQPFLKLNEFCRSDCWDLYCRLICHLRPALTMFLLFLPKNLFIKSTEKMSPATSWLNSVVFSALIVLRILYALPAFYGVIRQSDVVRIEAMFRKAKRWGITTDEFNMDFFSLYLTLSRLFENIKFDQHCLHHSLPQVHEVYLRTISVADQLSYEIPRAKISKLLNSFIYRCAKSNY